MLCDPLSTNFSWKLYTVKKPPPSFSSLPGLAISTITIHVRCHSTLYNHASTSTQSTLFSHVSSLFFEESVAQNFDKLYRSKTQISIHVVVENFKFRSMLSWKNSNFDQNCRRKIQISIHVVVEGFDDVRQKRH